VVHTSTNVLVCVNGNHVTTIKRDRAEPWTSYPPDLGKDVQDAPAAASFDGALDDVRVITGALPCE